MQTPNQTQKQTHPPQPYCGITRPAQNPSLSATSCEPLIYKGLQEFPNAANAGGDYVSGDAQSRLQMQQYKLPKLNNAGRNPEKKRQWFIYFSYRDHSGTTGRPYRIFKVYEGFAHCNTLLELHQHAEFLIGKYAAMLKGGWNPFTNLHPQYNDQITPRRHKWQPATAKYNIEYYLNLFLTDRINNRTRPKTISTYRSKIIAFVLWLNDNRMQKMVPEQLTADHIRLFMDHIIKTKNHNRTINSYRNTLACAFNWLLTKEIITINYWNKWKPLKFTSLSKRPFNSEQRLLIRNHLIAKNEQQMLLACEFVYYCFVRNGNELRNLKVRHLDLVNKQLIIEGTFSKNKKTETVSIPAGLYNKLMQMQISKYPPESYILSFKEPGPKQVSRDYWSKRFTRIIRTLGFNADYTMYSWKHSGNQVAHANGMPLKHQQRQNRHHSLDQMSTYLNGLEIIKSEDLQKYFQD